MIGISNQVIFAGFRKDIKEILSAIDILAVPSLVDDYPMIAMEGMAMGKPVIATRIEGVEEQIIDGETGILVLSWDANVLAKAINRIIDDNVLAEGLGKKAREKVQKDFSAEKMISETGEIYRSLSQDCAC
jgi:glycosyltransferase involved in cell wall biosynthesis